MFAQAAINRCGELPPTLAISEFVLRLFAIPFSWHQRVEIQGETLLGISLRSMPLRRSQAQMAAYGTTTIREEEDKARGREERPASRRGRGGGEPRTRGATCGEENNSCDVASSMKVFRTDAENEEEDKAKTQRRQMISDNDKKSRAQMIEKNVKEVIRKLIESEAQGINQICRKEVIKDIVEELDKNVTRKMSKKNKKRAQIEGGQ